MVLLDTHAAIWLAEGEPLRGDALDLISDAVSDRGVLISAVSGWEIGLLHANRLRLFRPSPAQWLSDLATRDGVRFVPLDMDAALGSQLLPVPFHRDPADRFLVATARALGIPIVTRDRLILAYAEAGHVLAVQC